LQKAQLFFMTKPTAPALKKQILDLLENLPDGVSLPRILTTLANHDAVLRMLAQAHSGAEPVELKQALARTAALLRTLEQWAVPTPAGEKAPTQREQTPPSPDEPTPTGAGASPGDLSDPTVLARYSRVKVHVDGASKGNPGPASAGIVITDVDGTPSTRRPVTWAHDQQRRRIRRFLRALEVLVRNGRPEAYVFADSQLMVNQMNLTWAVKHEGIKPLFSQAQKLKRLLPRFQIVHVTRDKNTRADALANLAIKQARDAGTL
jgi:ribonuclease HI